MSCLTGDPHGETGRIVDLCEKYGMTPPDKRFSGGRGGDGQFPGALRRKWLL